MESLGGSCTTPELPWLQRLLQPTEPAKLHRVHLALCSHSCPRTFQGQEKEKEQHCRFGPSALRPGARVWCSPGSPRISRLPRARHCPLALSRNGVVEGLHPIPGAEVANASLKLMPTKPAREAFSLCSPGGAAVWLTFVLWKVEPDT